MVIEYFIAGQPIIYLNGTKTIERSIADAFYVSETPDQTLSFVQKLADGIDEKADLREKALNRDAYRSDVHTRVIEALLNQKEYK